MDLLAPVLFALGAWWLSTVLMMWRSQRATPRCALTMAFMTVVAVIGLAAIVITRNWTGATGAYLAFLGGLAIWAWHEMSYFLAIISGPRPRACPEGLSRGQRFLRGVQASLWHELAIVATAAGLVWLCWGAANTFGALTFAVLWLMRWSAKLNIFLGVRNLHEEFWPDHLRYLGSYVHSAAMNPLFPVSMAIAGIALAGMIRQALGVPSMSGDQAGWMLLSTLMALAILEHVLLFLRVPDALLWRLATGEAVEPPRRDLTIELHPGPGS